MAWSAAPNALALADTETGIAGNGGDAAIDSRGKFSETYTRSTFVPARRVVYHSFAAQPHGTQTVRGSLPAMLVVAAGYIGCSFALGAGMMILVTFGLALAIATGIPGPHQR
jgi:hypothetical protein